MSGKRPPSLTGLALFALADASGGIPYLTVIRELHSFLDGAGAVYSIIGGVAAARAGESRTTGDIDILVRRREWDALRQGKARPGPFELGPDWGAHRETRVPIDCLFAGDDWDLPFPMPDPKEVREWDSGAQAWFMQPMRLLELKAAVYESKRQEFGEATAARDLADVRSVLASHPELGAQEALASYHPSVRPRIRSVAKEVAAYREKKPKRGRQ